MPENEISREIVQCAIEVHRTLGGPGLLEKIYEEALTWEAGAFARLCVPVFLCVLAFCSDIIRVYIM